MRDHEQGALILHEQVLEQVQRLQIEIVRGLVEHHDVARPRQHDRELETVALAARQLGDRAPDLVVLEQEVAQVSVHVALTMSELDHLAALRDVVAHRERGVQGLVQLREPHHLELGAHGDRALVGLELAQQQAQHGRLAAAVRPEDADAIAAHDRGVEPAHDRALAIAETQPATTHDHAARTLGFDHLALRAARLVAARGPLAAQFLEIADAPLVPGAAGLDAAPEPRLLECKLLVEQRRLCGLDLGLVLARHQVGVVTRIVAAQLAAIEIEDAGRQPAQELAIVGHEHERAAPFAHDRLEPFDRADIQMIRGLVEQQHVGLHGPCRRQQQSPLGTGAERGDRALERQIEQRGRLLDARLDLPRALVTMHAAGMVQPIERRAFERGGHVLRQPRHAQARLPQHLALIEHLQPHQHAHERGLAGAIPAQQPDALAGLEVQVHAIEQLLAAEFERRPFETQDRHRTPRPRACGAASHSLRSETAVRMELTPTAVRPMFQRVGFRRRTPRPAR